MGLKDMNRRDMLKTSLIGALGLASTAFLAACSKKEETAPKESTASDSATEQNMAKPEELSYVSESDNMATALGYKEDASKVSPSDRIEKMGVKGADQTCANCQFFKASESTNGEGGTCTLFQGKLVKTNAWCKSWAKKA